MRGVPECVDLPMDHRENLIEVRRADDKHFVPLGGRPSISFCRFPDDDVDFQADAGRVAGEGLERGSRVLARFKPAEGRQRQP